MLITWYHEKWTRLCQADCLLQKMRKEEMEFLLQPQTVLYTFSHMCFPSLLTIKSWVVIECYLKNEWMNEWMNIGFARELFKFPTSPYLVTLASLSMRNKAFISKIVLKFVLWEHSNIPVGSLVHQSSKCQYFLHIWLWYFDVALS